MDAWRLKPLQLSNWCHSSELGPWPVFPYVFFSALGARGSSGWGFGGEGRVRSFDMLWLLDNLGHPYLLKNCSRCPLRPAQKGLADNAIWRWLWSVVRQVLQIQKISEATFSLCSECLSWFIECLMHHPHYCCWNSEAGSTFFWLEDHYEAHRLIWRFNVLILLVELL